VKIFDCKCMDCKAEFQAVLENENDKPECPSCNQGNIEMIESEIQLGCGGGCSGCGGGCGAE
jgi:Zn finger protein HypA/HybF involved in hydrogenase expression